MDVGGVCVVRIRADKKIMGLLQVGWHGGWYKPMLGGTWAYERACEPDLEVVVVGSDALAGNCDLTKKITGLRWSYRCTLTSSADEHPRSSFGAIRVPNSTQGSSVVQLGPVSRCLKVSVEPFYQAIGMWVIGDSMMEFNSQQLGNGCPQL